MGVCEGQPEPLDVEVPLDLALCGYTAEILAPVVCEPGDPEVWDPPIPPYQCPCPSIRPTSRFDVNRTGAAGGWIALSKNDNDCCDPNYGATFAITVPCQVVKVPGHTQRVSLRRVDPEDGERMAEDYTLDNWVALKNVSTDPCTPDLVIEEHFEIPCVCIRTQSTQAVPVSRSGQGAAEGKVWIKATDCCNPLLTIGATFNIPCPPCILTQTSPLAVSRDSMQPAKGTITLVNDSVDCCAPILRVTGEINVPCNCPAAGGTSFISKHRYEPGGEGLRPSWVSLRRSGSDCDCAMDVSMDWSEECHCVNFAPEEEFQVIPRPQFLPGGTRNDEATLGRIRFTNMGSGCCDQVIKPILEIPITCPCMIPAATGDVVFDLGSWTHKEDFEHPSGTVKLKVNGDCCNPTIEPEVCITIPEPRCPCRGSTSYATQSKSKIYFDEKKEEKGVTKVWLKPTAKCCAEIVPMHELKIPCPTPVKFTGSIKSTNSVTKPTMALKATGGDCDKQYAVDITIPEQWAVVMCATNDIQHSENLFDEIKLELSVERQASSSAKPTTCYKLLAELPLARDAATNPVILTRSESSVTDNGGRRIKMFGQELKLSALAMTATPDTVSANEKTVLEFDVGQDLPAVGYFTVVTGVEVSVETGKVLKITTAQIKAVGMGSTGEAIVTNILDTVSCDA
jgi:hypothetical protein